MRDKIGKVSVCHRFIVGKSQNVIHWVFTLYVNWSSRMRGTKEVHSEVNSGSKHERM